MNDPFQVKGVVAGDVEEVLVEYSDGHSNAVEAKPIPGLEARAFADVHSARAVQLSALGGSGEVLESKPVVG